MGLAELKEPILQPAWYIIPSQNILVRHFNAWHWPYSLWHLSYFVIGTSLAPHINYTIMIAGLICFFLGMVIAAHYLDLLRGDPLRVAIPRMQLKVMAAVALALASAIGLYFIFKGLVPWWLGFLILLGVLFAVGYNLEFKGMHGDHQFALFWACFPVLVGYLAQCQSWCWALIPALLFAYLTARMQRVLSTQSRFIRRKLSYFKVSYLDPRNPPKEGLVEMAGPEFVLKVVDLALAFMSFAMVAIAIGLLL